MGSITINPKRSGGLLYTAFVMKIVDIAPLVPPAVTTIYGQPLSFTYIAVGEYQCTAPDHFPDNQTSVFYQQINNVTDPGFVTCEISADTLILRTYDKLGTQADGILNGYLEVDIYPA